MCAVDAVKRLALSAVALSMTTLAALSVCAPVRAQSVTLDNSGHVVFTRPLSGSTTAYLTGTITNPAGGDLESMIVTAPIMNQTSTGFLSGTLARDLLAYYNSPANANGATYTGNLIAFTIDSTTPLGTYDQNLFGYVPLFEVGWSNRASALREFSITVQAAAAVPEPGEYAVMGIAGLTVCGLMLRARRRRQSLGQAG